MKTVLMQGQRSWPLKSSQVEAWVTVAGGHLGPATFRCGGRKIRPLSVAPWAEEPLPAGTPPLLRALRGDFFCLPFGGNATAYRGESHPVHGETAHANWKLVSLERDALHARLTTRVRRGQVDKYVRLGRGEETCLYQRHVVSGMSGPMDLGHHLMLRFGSEALISTSRFVHGQVLPEAFESPERKGYQSLRPGARFTSLGRVPALAGGMADLSRYPARRGFEDLVMVVSDPKLRFAWTAASFPHEGHLCLTLKDPRVLRETVFWISNGGRHYPPWNGRHVDVMGLEEVTSYFHLGLADSVKPNPVSRRGHPTSVRLSPTRPLTVNMIFAVAATPRGFDRVAGVTPRRGGVTVRSASGKSVEVPLDLAFLGV